MSQQPPQPKVAAAVVAQPTTSGKAIASFILGLCSFFCMFFTGLPAIIFGVISLSNIKNSAGRLTGEVFAIIGIITGALGCLWTIPIMIALLLPAVQATREAARRVDTMNNMRQMALAMHNFHDANKRLPTAMPDLLDTNPKGSQLSWRVQILPFMEGSELYYQFNHDEPWDSPHNLALVEQMPDVFRSPSHQLEPGKTMYVVPTSPLDADGQTNPQTETIFSPGRSLSFQSMMDGSSNTILILEVDPDAAVIWTKPDEWEFDPDQPKRALGNARPGIILAAMADGSIRTLPNTIAPEIIQPLFTARAGD